MSGPLLDRIDALIEVPPLTVEDLDRKDSGESSSSVAQRVNAAREFARTRVSADGGTHAGSLEERSRLDGAAKRLVREALAAECLGGRGYSRVIRLARTIADLDGLDSVGPEHVGEALALRLDNRGIGSPY